MLRTPVAKLFTLHQAARSKDCKYYNLWRDVNKLYAGLEATADAKGVDVAEHVIVLLKAVRMTAGADFHLLEQAFYLMETTCHWGILVCAWVDVNYGREFMPQVKLLLESIDGKA